MYSLKALLTKNPVTLSGALVAAVNFLIIAGWWWDWDVQTVAAFEVALIAVLGLFVANTTASNQKLDELAGKAPRKAVAAKKKRIIP